jgi:hypothetical protein
VQQFSHAGRLSRYRDLAANGSPLVSFARERLAERGLDWTVRITDVWCRVEPADHTWSRLQGWKLHVSGAASSAETILRAVFDTLVDAGCPFKFACSLALVKELNSSQYPRGGAGKFVTAYPDDDEQAVTLAKALHEATDGMVGQVVLSDRPYLPGSLVSYRYGGFVGTARRGNDSDERYYLVAPDGGLVEDRRDAWYDPPPWARCPFPEPASDAAEGSASVLLDDRYLAREALRHANKGGVFLATDTETGVDVVIKQARRHVGVNEDGWEARDGLRNEARMLERFGAAGVATRLVGVFEQQGDLFLASEYVDGDSLRSLADTSSWTRTAAVAGQLLDLLDTVHGAGIVLRDLSPNNVLVRPDGRLVLIDLEFAAAAGDRPFPIGTPGYHAPEQLDESTVADFSADLYSLGALLYLLATGADPVFAMDEPDGRTVQQRIAEYLAAVGGYNEAARTIAPLVLGLVDAEPGRRWSLDRVRRFLTTPAASTGPVPAVGAVPASDRLVTDGLDWLVETMTPDAAERLWPAVCFGLQIDPCNVQHGAAGIAATLLQAYKLGYGDHLAEPLTRACAWIADRTREDTDPLPGLYFGRAGVAWLLHDAGVWLADDELARDGRQLARRLPLVWPNADVTHGSAGTGLTQLHLWRATGDDSFGDRLRVCVDEIAARARRVDDQPLWPTPVNFESEFAGKAFYGFAHGSAGIGWLLLAAGIAADRPDWRDLAEEVGEALCRVADRHDGGARWRSGPDENQAVPMEVWCNGSSGVGTFLIRLWRATGQDRFRGLAEEAAHAVWTLRASGSPANCHGLAGNGDFLLDMFDATGEDRYRSWAEDLAVGIGSQYVRRGGRYLVPNESRIEVTPEYGVGVAGTLAFLLRLRHGTERMWMAEPLSRTVASAR